jgi:N-methylhydantoinase B
LPGALTIVDVELDPIRVEVLWNKLIAIADESALALKRTSFSTIVRESNDFAVIIMDQTGDSLCHGTLSVPTFSGIASSTVKHLLREHEIEWWQPGDVVITNDPWLATGHKSDISMITPIFHGSTLVGFVGTSSHVSDIGGIGQTPDGRSLFEEGLGIPPMKYRNRGLLNEDLIAMIRDNVRTPDEVVGDLNAQVSAGHVAATKIVRLIDEERLPDLLPLSRQILNRAEASMRAAIRGIPNGLYEYMVTTDGFEAPIDIHLAILVDDDELELDFTGSSPQSRRGINCVLNYARAFAFFALKCALDPLVPKNEGSNRPFRRVFAPEGCIVNPRRPAPVFGRSTVGHLVTSAVFGALAPAIPDRVIADSGSAPGIRAHFSGTVDDKPFSFVLFTNGGMGSRHDKDGLSCTGFPTNAGSASMEVMESIFPLRCLHQELRQDSGGPGKYRGGLGQTVRIQYVGDDEGVLGMMADRLQHPAFGLFGADHGAPCVIQLDGVDVPPKGRVAIRPGQVLEIQFPGGGGYGKPSDRNRELIHHDLRLGLISRESALKSYGLHFDDPAPAPSRTQL